MYFLKVFHKVLHISNKELIFDANCICSVKMLWRAGLWLHGGDHLQMITKTGQVFLHKAYTQPHRGTLLVGYISPWTQVTSPINDQGETPYYPSTPPPTCQINNKGPSLIYVGGSIHAFSVMSGKLRR